MKRNRHHLLLAIVSLFILCSFSTDVAYYGDYSNTPVLMKRTDFEAAIGTIEAQELDKTSRISLLGDCIYIVELYKGIHVIDNTDPSNPKISKFINIPGCVDMTIKDNILYARSAEDLVAINIIDIDNVVEINRVRETFPELGEDIENYGIAYRFQKNQRPDDTVIVEWKKINNN